ncbi:hypothetical protein ACRE_079980 [Hapsidospora chrysogenum ATCC 11550]|uniref:Uncharacterized protein n=1 Tax=Hapsidospora chrysogenum (strain ATCC 11550 / CBS 779.69 / DSM 880 / IAM 14645 / JCM 23072 / IMI 49137) TaxID=857340 RepID=A0A086SW03_HAPC1|nr:hypothetical protein ACRE_079980 [Hapsidospora chrysogenum ATCC 11550]
MSTQSRARRKKERPVLERPTRRNGVMTDEPNPRGQAATPVQPLRGSQPSSGQRAEARKFGGAVQRWPIHPFVFPLTDLQRRAPPKTIWRPPAPRIYKKITTQFQSDPVHSASLPLLNGLPLQPATIFLE